MEVTGRKARDAAQMLDSEGLVQMGLDVIDDPCNTRQVFTPGGSRAPCSGFLLHAPVPLCPGFHRQAQA